MKTQTAFKQFLIWFTLTRLVLAASPAALAAAGDLDAGFNPNPDSDVSSIALQPDGKIILGGTFTSMGGTMRNRIARLNADGTLDPSFNPNSNGDVIGIALQTDGKILVLGGFTTIGGTSRNFMARLNADGSVDTVFNPIPNANRRAIMLQADGKIIFTYLDTFGSINLARLNTDGSADAGFNRNSRTVTINSLVLQPDGKVLIGGNSVTPDGRSAFSAIQRLNADGTVNAGFSPNVTGYQVEHLALQADGKILVLSKNYGTTVAAPSENLVRLNVDGTLDAAFKYSLNDAYRFLALQADGKILVAAVGAIKRLNPDGTVDLGFHADVKSRIAGLDSLAVSSIALQANGKVLMCGPYLASVNGTARQRIARLENDAATSILTVPDAGRVQWLRGGTSPEAQSVAFELSTDVGTTWTSLGVGTRISGGWELTGLQLPGTGLVRARARVIAGGSESVVEAVTPSFTSPPLVTVQPQGQTVFAGTNVTLSLSAAGPSPIGFQWRRNGTNIVGATMDRLTIPVTLLPNSGLYSAVAANAYGSVTSSVVVLSVMASLITSQPQSQTVLAGTNVTLSLSAVGSSPIGVQWRKNGTNIVGATADQLTISGVLAPDAGIYSSVLSNSYGSVTSSVAVLSVVTSSLTNQQVVRRANPQLSVSVASPVPLAYQWRANGVSITGATNASYTFTNAQTSHNGIYSVGITWPDSAVLSQSATVTVVPILRRVADYWPEQPLTVELDYSPAAGALSHTLTEQIPTTSAQGMKVVLTNSTGVKIGYAMSGTTFQLQPTNINFGGVFANGTFKWGPFFDDQPRVLRYTLVPQAGWTNTITFTGTFAEDSLNGGTVTINSPTNRSDLLPLHPADHFPPADNYITFEETLNYAAAWKASLLWPVPPFSELTGSYVNRAAVIWRLGEYYLDKGTNAPSRWQPAPAPARAAPASLADPTPGPIRKSAGASAALTSVPPTGNATRSVSRSVIDPVAPFGVTLSLPARTNADLMLVEEQLPPGWAAQAISDGGILDTNNAKVKWGPFLTVPPTGLTYQTVPAADARGTFTLFGRVGYSDGTINAIGGANQVTVGSAEPMVRRLQFSGTGFSGQTFRLMFGNQDGVALTGADLNALAVQVSNDLVTWSNLTNALTLTNGQALMEDPNARALPRRYYRVIVR